MRANSLVRCQPPYMLLLNSTKSTNKNWKKFRVTINLLDAASTAAVRTWLIEFIRHAAQQTSEPD